MMDLKILQLKNCEIEKLRCNFSNLIMINSIVKELVKVGGGLYAKNCEMIGDIKSKGNIYLENCPSVGKVRAIGTVTLISSRVSRGVEANYKFLKEEKVKRQKKIEEVRDSLKDGEELELALLDAGVRPLSADLLEDKGTEE